MLILSISCFSIFMLYQDFLLSFDLFDLQTPRTVITHCSVCNLPAPPSFSVSAEQYLCFVFITFRVLSPVAAIARDSIPLSGHVSPRHPRAKRESVCLQYRVQPSSTLGAVVFSGMAVEVNRTRVRTRGAVTHTITRTFYRCGCV
jgi:hypothetical protein